MSRDGYLPPGCTETDVDRACPGYDQEPDEYPDEAARQGQLEHDVRIALERYMELSGRAGVMWLISDFIKDHRLDQFGSMRIAAE